MPIEPFVVKLRFKDEFKDYTLNNYIQRVLIKVFIELL